jgi:hypothetical protein
MHVQPSKAISFSWPSVFDWCAPATTGWTAPNESAHQACVDMATQWQAFVGRRFNEDLHLLQELSAAKVPEEVWNAWVRFWQKAAENYGSEYSVISKLAAGSLRYGNGVSAAGSHAPTRAVQSKAA